MGHHLYLDESGDFAHARDTVCVAGVLCDPATLPPLAALEGEWRQVLWLAPWPFHAAHLNCPTLLALAVYAGSHRLPPEYEPHPQTAALVAHLRQAAPTALERALTDLARETWPPFEQVARPLEDATPKRHDHWLAQLQREVSQAYAELVRALFARAHLRLALATEAARGSLPRDAAAPEPYLALLAALIARAAALHQPLAVSPLARRLATGQHPGPRHLHDLLAPHVGAPFTVDAVKSFNANAHPLHVAADLIANRARQILRQRPKTLADLVTDLHAALGLDEATPPPLIVAVGDPLAPLAWVRDLRGEVAP